MNKKPISSILFTHDDLDGAGCRIIYSVAHTVPCIDPNDWKVVNCANVNVDELVRKTLAETPNDRTTEICFGDICCCRELLEELVAKYDSVKVWDHHRTNFWAEDVCGQTPMKFAQIVPENTLKVMQSGTSLMYQYYSQLAIANPIHIMARHFQVSSPNNRLLGKLVDTIRSYDTWEWKEKNNTDAKELQTLFFLLGMDRFCDRFITRLTSAKVDDVSDTLIKPSDRDFVIARIESEQERINNFTVNDVCICDVRGYRTALAINTVGMNVSELGNQFLTKHPDIDMFAAFSFLDGGTFSFRCIRDDMDTGADVAQPIGGGGHPKASGAGISDEFREFLIDALIDEMNGRPTACNP